MDELDIDVLKERYIQYKKEHYEDELEMRKLLELKRLIPSIVNEDSWKSDYKRLNEKLDDGSYYYNELKKVLSENELKKFTQKAKFKVLKDRFIKCKLNKSEDSLYTDLKNNTELFEELSNDTMRVVPAIDKLDKSLLASDLLGENDLIKKTEIICKYKKLSINVFFDVTAILKAEIARLFIDKMDMEDLDSNQLITACLVYAFKRTNSPQEIQRIKKEKEEDRQFLKSLGFDDRFCKICSEYNRYNEIENYEREKEGDMLELIDKFVGLIMHREDRLAFSVSEALDLIDTKIISGNKNQYKDIFIQFVKDLEKIEVSRNVGIATYFAKNINKLQRYNIIGIFEVIVNIRELLGDSISEQNLMKLENIEKIRDKASIIEIEQEFILKLKEKVASMSKILKGYEMLSQRDEEG